MDGKYFTIRAAAFGNSAEIYIYESIGSSHGGISAKDFAEELKKVGLVDRLNVFINSDGGSVFDGMTIHEHLRRHPAYVTTYIDGLAASIASVIALAGDEVVMAANAMMMIHDPWATTSGSAEEMQKSAEVLDKVRKQILNIYIRRTGSDRDTIEDMMRDETWMDAAEAISLGFADEISVTQDVAAHYDLSRFRNPPNDLGRRYGVKTHQRSRARSRITARAAVEYCNRKTMKMLREHNKIN